MKTSQNDKIYFYFTRFHYVGLGGTFPDPYLVSSLEWELEFFHNKQKLF